MTGAVNHSGAGMAVWLKSWRKETRSILRRWLKTVFTTRLKRASSQSRRSVALRVMRMTALLTLGGGLNTFSST